MFTPKLGEIILDNAKLFKITVIYGFQLTNGTTDRYIPSLLYEIHDTYFLNLIHDLLPSFHQTNFESFKKRHLSPKGLQCTQCLVQTYVRPACGVSYFSQMQSKATYFIW